MRNIQREDVLGGHLHVIGASDAFVDVVRPAFVVDQVRDRGGRRHVLERLDFRGTDAEAGAAEQVIDFRIELGHSGFTGARDRSQRAIVTTPSVKEVAN
jgi:hypothetical protein